VLLAATTLMRALETALAEPTGLIVSQIRIEGNIRVETDAIRFHMSQRERQPLDTNLVNDDIKSIYQMTFFDEVNVKKIPQPDNKVILVYQIKERPMIMDVRIEGMKAIRSTDEEIVAAVRVHSGSITTTASVKETIDGIISIYHQHGYPDAKVMVREVLGEDNTAVMIFHVDEGAPAAGASAR